MARPLRLLFQDFQPEQLISTMWTFLEMFFLGGETSLQNAKCEWQFYLGTIAKISENSGRELLGYKALYNIHTGMVMSLRQLWSSGIVI